MRYQAHFTVIATIAFLAPNSKAIISSNADADMDTAGYYCQRTGEIRSIKLSYGNTPQGLPCQVTYQKNKSSQVVLLRAQRNASICENKAKIMAARLIDRGWQCLSSDI